MAREFDGPLTKADIAWLEARYSENYVARMVSLHGTKKGGKAEPKVEEPENGSETAEGKVEGADVPESTEGAGDGTEEPEEDLIGDDEADVFDVIGSTEAEVKTWAESADAEAKAAALATESAREDRDPRKGVVALLS